MNFSAEQRERLDVDGYVTLARVFDAVSVDGIVGELGDVLERATAEAGAIRGAEGPVYAARNLLELWPGTSNVWRRGSLTDALCNVLGPDFGLVRALFFDKPPGHSWALPWHKDLTVAVRDNQIPTHAFSHPTRKAGVPHFEAPVEVLEAMLTARIHLDDVNDENGPLKVIAGSHRTGKTMKLEGTTPSTLHARRGDVLLMRPLLAHCSGKSVADTTRRRRVLHLEFAASAELPEGVAWHDFVGWRSSGDSSALESGAE